MIAVVILVVDEGGWGLIGDIAEQDRKTTEKHTGARDLLVQRDFADDTAGCEVRTLSPCRHDTAATARVLGGGHAGQGPPLKDPDLRPGDLLRDPDLRVGIPLVIAANLLRRGERVRHAVRLRGEPLLVGQSRCRLR